MRCRGGDAALAEGEDLVYSISDVQDLRARPRSVRMSRGAGTSVALMLMAVTTELVVFSNGHGPIRVALAATFLLLAPGWAIQQLAHLEMTLSARIALALGISTAVDMAAASVLLYTRLWSMDLALTIVVAVVLAAVVTELPAAGRSSRPPDGPGLA